MSIQELLEWQWDGYPKYHASRANLLLHIVVVPMFLAGNVGVVVAPLNGSWGWAVVSIVAMVVSVALQGRGHRIEEIPSVPFTVAANAISRILLEQWVNFPRFVATGGWLRALRKASP